MVRALAGALILMVAAGAMAPVSAMEPLQRSQADATEVATVPTALDLASEQDHFSASSGLYAGVRNGSSTPAAPGEKGRVPQGHALMDLNF